MTLSTSRQRRRLLTRRLCLLVPIALLSASTPFAVPPAGSASPAAGTDIGNAGVLTSTASGSLPSGASDDWWVIFPKALGDKVALTVKDSTTGSTTCGGVGATLDGTGGSGDPLGSVALTQGTSGKVSGSETASDRYFVEVVVGGRCNAPSGEPVRYTLTLDAGGGGSPPTLAKGSIAAGASIGRAAPPLRGATSYAGTIASGGTDAWYELYKKPDDNPASVRVENTTVSGSTVCSSLGVNLYGDGGSDDPVASAALVDNAAATLTVPAKDASDPTGLYYLEIRDGGCAAGGTTYRLEPEPGSEWENPAARPSGSVRAGSSIGAAGPALLGGTTYDGTVESGQTENWYVLYKKSDDNAASVRVEDTTVSGSTSCSSVSVDLYGADGAGDPVGGAALPDNAAATLLVAPPPTPDYLGRYFLEITDSGCTSGGTTYRIDPEPSGEWTRPVANPTEALPSGGDAARAGGPLQGGVTYEAALAGATSEDWSFFVAVAGGPVTVSVEDSTNNEDNCTAIDVNLENSADESADAVGLVDDQASELEVDAAGTYYLELSVAGDCPPNAPLEADVTLSGSVGSCSSTGLVGGTTAGSPVGLSSRPREDCGKAWVAAIRFASPSASAPGTPGLPVIKDDGTAPVGDHSVGSACADGISDPKDFDYLNCGSEPSSTPQKNWPVVHAAASGLTLNEVVVTSSLPLTSPRLAAKATIGGVSLSLAATPLTPLTAAGGLRDYGAVHVEFAGKLPAVAGDDSLAVTWSLTDATASTPVALAQVTSSHVYVTAAPYRSPQDVPASLLPAPVPPYVTLVEVGTQAAAGLSKPQAVFDAIAALFRSRKIAHPILDEKTGSTKSGPLLSYYHNGFDTVGDFWNKSPGACPVVVKMLSANSGHCGDWAAFLAGVLAYQGIPARYLNISTQPPKQPADTFYFGPSPDPSAGTKAAGHAYMLLGPGLWTFGAENASGHYPYDDTLSVNMLGTVTVAGTAMQFHPSKSPIAEGGIATPPPMFVTGDHAIVHTQWGYVDPSYGQPQSGKPYPTVLTWERASIAGFAAIYARNATGKYVPVPSGSEGECALTKCFFAAVPYAKSGAPA